ncbi:MAG: T9SS type A sorting domain-containing protein [Bacteroidales bacterium]|nr:T9SS type A sorting domain-containing protein [Bacteroidales bacterium]
MKNYLAPLFIIFIITAYCMQASAQSDKNFPSNQKDKILLEFVDDGYVPSHRQDHPVSPAYKYSSPGFFTVQVNVDEDGNNILGDAANEPSITVDPNDPNKIAIGWRQFDNVNNNFRQAGIGFSADAGQTWTFPGVIDPGVFRSDPVLDYDNEGNFYYNSLTVVGEDYLCDVYRSDDGGETWDEGVYAYGGDKQWMTIDHSEGIGAGNLYAYWTSYYSICYPDFFTRSVNGGDSWEDCVSIDGEPYWGTLTVDADGNLYIGGISWNGFRVIRSSTAQDPDAFVTWDYDSQVNLDGELVGFGGYQCPNPSGLLGQTIIDCDRSEGPNHGNVYLLASVQRYSNNDPCDVMFSKSTNGGLTWSTATRINDDPANSYNYQWFGTMSVAPDGRIDVVWLDTRDNPGTVYSVLYYSYSMDGGDSWSENVPLSDFFDPHLGWPDQDKMGDYFDMISDETGAHLAWANTFNGEQDVYYAHIIPSTTGINKELNVLNKNMLQNYPNPFKHNTSIRYNLNQDGFVSIKIYDVSGREVATVVNEEKSAGQYIVNFNASGLVGGLYYSTLTIGSSKVTRKMMIMN